MSALFTKSYAIAFHCAGLRAAQWRKIRNELHKVKGRVFFNPGGVSGPVAMSYLDLPDSEVTHNDWKEFCHSLTKISSDYHLLILAGRYKQMTLNHLDVTRTLQVDESEYANLVNHISSFAAAPLGPLTNSLHLTSRTLKALEDSMRKQAEEKASAAPA